MQGWGKLGVIGLCFTFWMKNPNKKWIISLLLFWVTCIFVVSTLNLFFWHCCLCKYVTIRNHLLAKTAWHEHSEQHLVNRKDGTLLWKLLLGRGQALRISVHDFEVQSCCCFWGTLSVYNLPFACCVWKFLTMQMRRRVYNHSCLWTEGFYCGVHIDDT